MLLIYIKRGCVILRKFTFIFILILSCLFLVVGCTIFSKDSKNESSKSPSTNEDSKDLNQNSDSKPKKDTSIIATIYTSDIEAENLINKEVSLKELTAESIFEELKNSNVIVKDAKLNGFDNYKDDDDLSVGVANFSSEFYNFNLGSSYESLMLDSIAKTYMENFKLDKFKILVSGEEYESGHILFTENDFFTKDYFD